MRAACDACRLRKVKCVTHAGAQQCVSCTSLNIQCAVTARARKRRVSSPIAAPGAIGPAAGAPPPAESSRHVPSASTSAPRPTRTSPRNHARLLGVPGLTAAALDACLECFFATVGRVFRISLPANIFLPRARVALYHATGLPVPAELEATPAASRLLVLAVACCGAPFCAFAALAEPLYNTCRVILSQPEIMDSASALDTIDAVLLLSELYVRSRHAASGTRQSPTTLDPLGKGTVVDLMFFHKLHIPLPDSPDHMRRQALFWTVFVHDAIRSASAHTCYRIGDEDYAWPSIVDLPGFPYTALSIAVRRVCDAHLSPKVKGAGYGDDEVESTLAMLLPLATKLTVSVDTVRTACTSEPTAATPTHAFRPLTAVEQLFMLSIGNWLRVVLWVAVQENDERHPGRVSKTMRASVEAATMAACEEMATLAELCVQYRLLLYAPRSIRNHMASFTLFLVRAFKAIDEPSVAESSKYFALAETLNRGIRTASMYPDSAALADTLRMALYHARVQTTDATRVAERGLQALKGESLPAEVAPTPTPAAGVGRVGRGHAADDSSIHDDNTDDDAFPGLVLPEQPAAVLGAAIASAPLSALFSSISPTAPTPEAWAATLDPSSASSPVDWSDLVFTLKECGFGLPFAPT
ncbi:hypothetical protein VHUM_04057 [Vanrija humicola]|uniref:Zn(2)-C6 fungal-type domain-containing protein n=1 Tax=Vanrija humicola TaxID=5417 RepID=A0A7D8UYN3_VANHU|nr:hypothetical protein VHUM_04057 [Vanrija humicola]